MPNLEELFKSLNIPGSSTQGGPGFPVTNNANVPTSQLEQLVKSLEFSKGNPSISGSPANNPMLAPTGVYNVSNPDTINYDAEVTNSDWRNMWNSFKRGIDEIQISTAQGKFEYSPTGDSAAQIIDNYPDEIRDLQTQLQKGLIDQVEYEKQTSSLDKSYQNALSAKAEMENTVASNNIEIANEPVSKEYQYKNWLTQQAGDKASLADKAIYAMPQVMGSSASLMLPQLAATFGANVTKSLIKAAALNLIPGVGEVADAIAVVGSIGASIAEVAWGRSQESYGEVGSTIMENRRKLEDEYIRSLGVQSLDDIPDSPEKEEALRQIRIQSRKGADTQFMENMALAANDVAQAIIMPGSQLAGVVEGSIGSLGKILKSAGEYNKVTRVLRTVGGMYYNALGEKFEEGFQQAAQYRATDQALNTKNYVNKGLMASILTDSYDTVASLNYSMIPGIDLRGTGKYSQDKEFQFAENSGGMLGLVMGAIPAAISVGKDIATYRNATRRLAADGVINPDDKVFRLQNNILETYFKKDKVQYLVEAMTSLRGKKGENGQEIMSDQDFADSIKNIKEAYKIYQGASDRINGLKGDKWAFFTSKELSQARAMLKSDLFHNALGTIRSQKNYTDLLNNRTSLEAQESQLSGDDPQLSNYKNLLNQLENATNTRDVINNYLQQNLDLVSNVGERTRPSLEARAEFLKNYINRLQKDIETERTGLEAANIDHSNTKELGTDMDKANRDLITASMNLDEYQRTYNDILKVKTHKQAKDYFNKQMQTRQFAEGSQMNTEEGAAAEEPVDAPEDVDNEEFQQGYEEEIPEEEEASAVPDSTLVEFTGTTTQASPEGESYVNNTVREAFNNALDELESAFDDVQPGKTASERIQALEEGLAKAGIDLSKLSFKDLFKIFRDNFVENPEYVKSKFESLRALSLLYKSIQGAKEEELKQIRNYELDGESLTLLGETREYATPPEQTAEQVASANDEVIKSAAKEEDDNVGSGLKITSGLSLATANVISGRTADRQVGDFREEGQMQFSDNGDQQLVNTNFVSVGDTLNIRISSLPEAFDPTDTSDDNYDLVNIEVYKTVKENSPNGQVERELLLGSLHRIAKLPDLIAESSDLKAEQDKLRIQRRSIIQSNSKSFTATIENKGFGFLNKNNRSQQVSIYDAFGADLRVHISTVAASGQAIELIDGLTYKRGIVPLIPGATVAFIPNETATGTVYIPIYLTKKRIADNKVIFDKVTASITEFLKTGSRRFMTDAEKYVYITREPNEKLGLRGVYWNYSKDNSPVININGTRYTTKNVDSIKNSLQNIYFTPNRNALKDDTYKLEIWKSGLLTTNITANKVLKDRFQEYSFLDPYQSRQYFSQHTITLGSFKETKGTQDAPQNKQTASKEPTSEVKAEISRLRAERISKAKEMGMAFEDGKGSLKNIYDVVVSQLSDPEVVSNPENSSDVQLFKDFLTMYEDYESRIQNLREDNSIKEETSIAATSTPVLGTPSLFAGTPMAEGYFSKNTVSSKQDNTAYNFYVDGNRATFTLDPSRIGVSGLSDYRASYIEPAFDLVNQPTKNTQSIITREAGVAVKDADGRWQITKKGLVEFSDQPGLSGYNPITQEVVREENQEVKEELTNLGVDLDFDDLIGFTEVVYDDTYKSNLNVQLGLKNVLGARYTQNEVEAIKEALNSFNKKAGTNHQIYVNGIGDRKFIAISLQSQITLDDIQAGDVSLASKLLVSKDISATLQNQMVDSIAYSLLNNQKPESTEENKQKEDTTNKELVKKDLESKLSKFKILVTKENTSTNLDKINTLIKNYQLMIDHYDALYNKAIEVLKGLGFEATDTNSDFFENLEENMEDNNVTQFNEDANSTRNQKNFLPSEVKKLIYFIPNLQLRDLTDPKQVDEMNDPKNAYFGKNYKAKPNALGLPSFNDFNDTWEKTLSIVSQKTYTSDDSGFNNLLENLLKDNNPIIVKELASRLKQSNDQVKNAFFRRTYLQKQQNKTTIVNYRNNRSYKDQNGQWHQSTTTKTTQIINADQRQGIRFVANELEQEFLVNGLRTGILTTEVEASTGRQVSKVNTVVGKQLYEDIKTLLSTNTNFIVEREAVGNVKAKYSSKFTDAAKALLLEKINSIGINFSYGALNDLLRYYRVANSQYTGDERAVALEVFQNTIFKRLAGLSGTTSITNQVEAEGEQVIEQTDYEANNPFKKDPSTIQSLARFEFGYRTQNQSGSYRSNGKSYYPYTRHSYLSEMFTDITAWLRDRTRGESAEKNVFAKLRTDHFAQQSLYLQAISNPIANPEFAKIFKLRYELGTRNRASIDGTDKLLQEMTPREHQIAKITDFQNSGNRAASFHYDTLSDKITKPIVDVLRQDVVYNTIGQSVDAGNIVLAESTTNNLYRYFTAEYTRINDVRNQNITLDEHEKIKGYHDIGKKEGMGKMFNMYYFLNRDVLLVDNPELANNLYNIDGSLQPLSATLEETIKAEINKHFNKLYVKTKADFKALGLFDLENRNARKEFDPLIQDIVDANYLKKNAIRLGLENVKGLNKGQYYKLSQDQLNRIVDYAVVDYVTNYAIFSNEMLMFTGDPAQAGKLTDSDTIKTIKERYPNEVDQKKYIAIANVVSTFVNVGKRNAAFLGSGEKGKFMNSLYSVAIANDINIASPQFDEYTSLFIGNEAAVKKAYNDGDLTDAQEVTTVEEKLHVMMAFGQITKNQYKKFLYIYDRAHYNDLFPGESETISDKDRFEAYGTVMQPDKPVQRTYNIDEKLHASKQYYIKTSSYPLVPDLIKGTPLEALLNDMKAQKVQRIAFVSATKQGVAGAKNLFNKDGLYNESFLENNQNTLERDGFRIQLEVPYHDDKDAIREGTQLAKLLFVDIPEDLNVNYQNKQTRIQDVKKKYNDYHKEIINVKTQELYEELGAEVDQQTGLPIITDIKKLATIIQEEGIGRGYSINALLGLDLNEKGQFKVPLTFLPNTGQIQPVLTAIVSNRIARLKMPGKSYVQGSEFILNRGKVESDLSKVDQRSIVWTKPEYSGTSKLKYLREEGGKVKPAQIIMPFYFINEKTSKRVDLRQYTTKDAEGRTILDASQIDPELLEMNGFRIPFQGHNSGMWFEIIGFLPYEMGDLILVPGEIAAQMGSDYDVDKLYAYMFNYNVDSDSGIRKVPSYEKLTKDQELSPDSKVKALQNSLIDIHKAIFTSKELFQPILDPLGFGDVEDAIAELGSEESSEFLGAFDPTYQRDVYFSNRGGQLGVGITANANTSHSMAQSINLYIKGQGIVFLDEEGNEYVDHPDFSDKNRVTSIGPNTYTEETADGLMNQNDGSQKSAWRLDKIYTFTTNPKTGKPYKISNLISQLLGVSVDNAKEQKLGAYGLNKFNFNVAVSIIRAGFDLKITKAFINQPILKEYYAAIGDTEDMFSVDFAPNKREAVTANIFKTYGERFGVDYNAIFNRDFVKGFSLEEMKDSLGKEINQDNAQQQLEVLKAFLHYKNLSDGLQGLVSALNIDTKGLPKNVSEAINKIEAIENNVTSNELFGNTRKFYSQTIPGLFSNLPVIFESLFANPKAPLFAYSSPAYIAAQNKIEFLTGRPIVGQEKLDRFHNSIKQFLYTSDKIVKTSSIEAYRSTLLFDTEGNNSLQTDFLALRAQFPNNELLRAINPIVSEYVNDPKRLEIVLSSEEDYTERIRQYWEFMLNNEEEPSLKEFAEKLVDYALLASSQEYGTSNLIKYIPFSALENIGFGSELNRLNESMFQDEDLLEAFSYQFIQHEMDYVLAAKEKNFIKDSVQYKTITTIVDGNKEVTNNTNIINKFSLPLYNPDSVSSNPAASLLREDEDGNWDYPEVLSVFIDSQIGKLLYRKNQTNKTVDYYRIDTLGSNNLSEYNLQSKTGFAKSLIESNQSNIEVPGASSSSKTFETKPKIEVASNDISLSDKYLSGVTSVNELTNRLIGNLGKFGLLENVPYYFTHLAEAIDRYNIVLPIELNPNHNTRATTVADEQGVPLRLVVNPNLIFKGDRAGVGEELDGVRSLLHELIHVVTLQQLTDPAYTKSPQYRQLNSVWEEYRDTVRRESKSKLRGVNTNVFDAELFSLLVDRYKTFRGQNAKQADIYKANIQDTINNLQKDQDEFNNLLHTLGRNLQQLAAEGKVDKANYDLTSNSERLTQFKNRITTDFYNNINDNINKYYGYMDIREFVTEAMTNPKTQEELKKIPSLWERLRGAISSLLARILGYDKNERSLLDDAIDATMDLVALTKDSSQQNQQTLTDDLKTDTFQYFGGKYEIVLDLAGKGIDIKGYKGKASAKQVILDYYNQNPDIDPQNGKYFRKPSQEQRGTQFNMSREYRIPSGKIIRFNDQQYEGLEKVTNWLKSPDSLFFALDGFAGTGKTTIVKAVLDTYQGSVAVTAPTHKAKNVISKTTGRSAETIQKLLGLRPNTDLENFDPAKPVFDPLARATISSYRWLILDEASMLNKSLFKLLLEKARQSDTKILFMGDPAQIPPVGEAMSNVFSSTEIKDRHSLDKVERQAGSNPLMSVYDKIRQKISSSVDMFDHKTKLNKLGEGIEFTDNDEKFKSQVIQTYLSADYDTDRNFAKLIGWRNKTISSWNKIIRTALFGDNARQYEQGDTIMSYTNITTPMLTIENSSDYVVERSLELGNHGVYGFDGFQLAIRDIDTKVKKEIFIVKNNIANMTKYYEVYTKLLNQAKVTKRWQEWYAFRNNNLLGADIMSGDKILVPKDFDYGYAITAHKSQGSTYNQVFVLEGDIDGNSDATERNKIKYVAFSRPTSKVTSLTAKTEQEGTNFYIEQDEMLASLPRDVNEVSDSEVENLLKFCKG